MRASVCGVQGRRVKREIKKSFPVETRVKGETGGGDTGIEVSFFEENEKKVNENAREKRILVPWECRVKKTGR